jgi:hypothetical protein
MIYGYDNDKKQLLAIGFNQNMIYSKLVFNYADYEVAFQSGKTCYKETAPWSESSAVQLIEAYDYEQVYPYINARILNELKQYIYAIPDYRRKYIFLNPPEEACSFGIKVYDDAIDNLENLFKGKTTIDYRAMHFIWEHKKGIYDRIKYAIAENKLTGEIVLLTNEYLKVIDLANSIKMKSFELENSSTSDSEFTEDQFKKINNIIQLVKELKKLEYDILLKIYRQLELEIGGEQSE